jgi:hypothetical protein
MTKLMLTGFTNKNAEDLLPLAKSWAQPPEVKTPAGVSVKFDQAQRAFVIDTKNGASQVSFEIQASENSPVLNPGFVINGWGNRGVKLELNGKTIARGKDFRYGHRQNLNSVDLIAWVRYKSTNVVKVVITAQ